MAKTREDHARRKHEERLRMRYTFGILLFLNELSQIIISMSKCPSSGIS